MEDKTYVMGTFTASLELTLPDGSRQTLDLIQDEMVVGRGKDCHLVVLDEKVSRRHALLKREGGTYLIEDLGSSNGLLVNGTPVRSRYLAQGDVVTLGDSRLLFFLAEPPAGGTVVAGGVGPSSTQAPPSKKAKPPKPPKMKAEPSPAGGKRKLLLVGGVTVLVAVVAVGLLSMLGGDPASSPAPAPPAAVAPPAPAQPAPQAYAPPAQPQPAPQAYAPPAQPQPAPQAYAPPAQPQPAPQAYAPAGQPQPMPPGAGGAPGQPAAPPQNQARLYYEQGQVFFDAGRLPDAVAAWSRAVALDPSNQMAQVKLQKAKEELARRAEEAFNRGMRNFQYLNYEQAVQDWMQVLHLLPDPGDPLHRKAREYMEQARLKLNR